MRKKVQLLLMMVVMVVVLCSCQQFINDVKQAYNEAQSNSSSNTSNSTQYEKYTFGNIQVELPGGWSVYEETDEFTTLQLDQRRIVFSKKDTTEKLTEESVLYFLTGHSYKDDDIISCQKKNICGGKNEAYMIEIQNSSSTDANILSITFKDTKSFYMIAIPVKKTGTDDWRSVFDKIVNSITIVSNSSSNGISNGGNNSINSEVKANVKTFNDISFEIPDNWKYTEEDTKASAGSESDYTFLRLAYSTYDGNEELNKSNVEEIVNATKSKNDKYKNMSTNKTTIGSETINGFVCKFDAVSSEKTLKSCVYVFKVRSNIYLAFYVCLDESKYESFLEIVEKINKSISVVPGSEKELSFEEKNARRAAESYLVLMSFSRKGLIEQLQFEGYNKDVCINAVDSMEIDWNEQAAKSAESYLELMSFSKKELIEQLQFDGFTKAQAEYAAKTVGYK